jgi:hypothetical protein
MVISGDSDDSAIGIPLKDSGSNMVETHTDCLKNSVSPPAKKKLNLINSITWTTNIIQTILVTFDVIL